MTIERLQLIRNVGQFDSVTSGAQLPLAKIALCYAENGRGKTTLAAIFRSAGIDKPSLIEDRKRLGAQHEPHIVMMQGGARVTFQNNTWSAVLSQIAVFDDAFVAENVCSGVEIGASHRQNLHELILGAQGVALNADVQRHVDGIEGHNRLIRQKENELPPTLRGRFTVDQFCALPVIGDIAAALLETQQALAAAHAADEIREEDGFSALELPAISATTINALLARNLPDLAAEAAALVSDHLARLGRGGEMWVSEGVSRMPAMAAAAGQDICPFCAQGLENASLIGHYQGYFSAAYDELKRAAIETERQFSAAHSGDVIAAFERSIRQAHQSRDFWRQFLEVPEVAIDTEALGVSWSAARDAVLETLRRKIAAPLEPQTLPADALNLVGEYERRRAAIQEISAALLGLVDRIGVVKAQAQAGNAIALEADLARLVATQLRYEEPTATVCQEYLEEKAAKAASEGLRTVAREALDNYRQNVFPAYEATINAYLARLNAGFRLGAVASVNQRTGSSCTYNVLINNIPVALRADAGPSFRTTLSAGDRNALALAFFFASLEQDPRLAQKIVVIDDPMTSLDEHRSLSTIHELRRLLPRVAQIIVLSHSKPFLCALWEGADKTARSALTIRRDVNGSTLAPWDVNQDCITENDRRHRMIAAYMAAADANIERQVAAALRPILEAFMRVAYPATFPPSTLLGPFLGVCEQRVGHANQILAQGDIDELRMLLDYANRFHHDTNPAWEAEVINDQQLAQFCQRTISFARRA